MIPKPPCQATRRVVIACGADEWMVWNGGSRSPGEARTMALADAKRAFRTLSAHRPKPEIPPLTVADCAKAKPGQGPELEIATAMWSATGLPLDGRDGPEMPWSRDEALAACVALARLAGTQCDPEKGRFATTIGGYNPGSHIWQPLWLWSQSESRNGGAMILNGIWRSAAIAAPLAAMATGKGTWSRHVGPRDPGSATLRALEARNAQKTRRADAQALATLMRKAGLGRDASLIDRSARR